MIIKGARILSYGVEEGIYNIEIQDKKITYVGQMDRDERGKEVIDVEGAYVTPGLIDAHTHLGMKTDSQGVFYADHNEKTEPITPEARGIDGINPQNRDFQEARLAGITSCATGPGSANLFGGQYAAVKTYGETIDDIVIDPYIAMKMALGENPKRVYNLSRMGIMAKMREFLTESRIYMEEKAEADDKGEKKPKYNAKYEAMIPVLKREKPVKIHAHRGDDIVAGAKLAKEFNLRFTLDHLTCGVDVLEFIGSCGAEGLIVGPSLGARTKVELTGKGFEGVVKISEQNDISIITDSPVIPAQYLPICVGLAISKGMDYRKALEAVTINPSRIMGIDDRVGSIEAGKDADLVVWKEKPFVTIQDPDYVMIEGKLIKEKNQRG